MFAEQWHVCAQHRQNAHAANIDRAFIKKTAG